MLSSVLRGPRAVRVNIEIMRVFVTATADPRVADRDSRTTPVVPRSLKIP